MCVRGCVRVCMYVINNSHHRLQPITTSLVTLHPAMCSLLCSVFIAVHCVRVFGCVCRCRWGRDGYVLTRQQQQQQPVETKAGWFIAPYREHKSHLQRRAFKRPASWQHLPFINDWAEPPTEPATTKLTHSPSNSSFVSPLLPPSLTPSIPPSHFNFFSPSISRIILSPSPSSLCFCLPLWLSKYCPPSSYLSPPWPPFLHLQGMMGYSHCIALRSPSVYIYRGYIAQAA